VGAARKKIEENYLAAPKSQKIDADY